MRPPVAPKRQLADLVHQLIATLDLRNLTLVGQDVSGMIVYPYVRSYDDIARAVITDVVIPGVDPWEEAPPQPVYLALRHAHDSRIARAAGAEAAE